MQSLPPHIWNGIFGLLQVLFVGLILGLFASKYQKRKEVEFSVKGNILLKRLETLEKVHKVNCELFHKIAPPASVQMSFLPLLERIKFPIYEIEYPTFFDSEASFDDYYNRIGKLIGEERIYFDYNIDRRLSEYSNYLLELKLLLDAFSDTVNGDDSGRINTAYQLFGVILQKDFSRFYAIIDKDIAVQLRDINLAYKDQYFRKFRRKAHYKLALETLKHLKKNDWKGKISNMVYYRYLNSTYGNSVFLNDISFICLLLMYVYYSNKYTVSQFDEIADEERNELIESFHTMLMMNYHV